MAVYRLLKFVLKDRGGDAKDTEWAREIAFGVCSVD